MSSVTKHQRYREQSAEHVRERPRSHGPTSAGALRTHSARSHSARRVATKPEVVGSSSLDVPHRSPRDDVRSADSAGRRSPTAPRASPVPPPPSPSSPMPARSRWTNVADKFNASRRRSVCNGGQTSQPAPPLPPILAKGRRHSVAGVSPLPDRRLGELTQPLTGSLTEVVPPKSKIPFPRMGSQTFMEVLQEFQEELQLSNALSQAERDAQEATETRRRVHFRYDVRLE